MDNEVKLAAGAMVALSVATAALVVLPFSGRTINGS